MKDIKIAVIGLGYVGLPLARLFATKYPVVGFDINTTRVAELRQGHDATLEVENEVLQAVLLDSLTARQAVNAADFGDLMVAEEVQTGLNKIK